MSSPELPPVPDEPTTVEPTTAEPLAAPGAVEERTDSSASASVAEAAADSAEAAAPVEAKAAEPAGRAAKKLAAKRRRPKPRTARVEEFVAPSPEELAGIPSDIVRAAVEGGTPVGGKVIGWNQGGFHVVVEGITGFCPRSSMELGAPHEPAKYLDQEYLFRVLRVEEKGRRLVLSRAAVLLEEKRHLAEEARKKVQLGAVLKGKVVSVLDFGAFVDLGGVEGMIHVSELGHQRVAHPSEVLEVGQEVEAKVVKLPAKKGERASLSLRALAPDPWAEVAERWPAGGPFTGKVLRKSDFGWFVELAPGIEGLLHPSNLAPGQKPDDPALAPGSELSGWVREVEPKRHRISLSLREVATGDPWKGVEQRFAEGAVVSGTIERLAPFGAFVILEPGLTGLFPMSEMGLPRGASVGKAFPVGREVKVKVAEVDPRRKRISLTRVEKTLEGSKSDYQAYQRKSRQAEGMGALAAALQRLRS
jgi:small subunit ribosomal protein S1